MARFVIKITVFFVKLIQQFPSILETKKRQYLCCNLNQQTKYYLFILPLPLCSWILNCYLISIKGISELLKFASVNSRFGGVILLTKTACKLRAFLFSETNLNQKIRLQTFSPHVYKLRKVVLQAANILLQSSVSLNPIVQDSVDFKGNWTELQQHETRG